MNRNEWLLVAGKMAQTPRITKEAERQIVESKIKIGILALQGDFDKHRQMIEKLECETMLVRKQEELLRTDGLIIPGGESTTLLHLIQKHGLWDVLRRFSKQKPVFGTCAGLIVLSRQVLTDPMETLQAIELQVARNAYGRQVDSFIDRITINLNGQTDAFEGFFIRAPKIVTVGGHTTAIGWHRDDVVMAEQGHVLAATFHPELTDDPKIHRYFLEKVVQNIAAIKSRPCVAQNP